MSEEDAFLRAICESPDDDTPRLVFADWLTEQCGAENTAWANGIRAQIWQARGATDAALAQQSKVFESSYGEGKLLERLGLPRSMVFGWERGFPAHATGNFRELRDNWPRLAFRVPIRKLHIHDLSESDTADFVTWPMLPSLSDLNFGGIWTMPTFGDLLPILTNCAELRGLKVLSVWYVDFNDANATALLDSPHLAGLGTFHLAIRETYPALSRGVTARLVARFGEGVFAPF